jgi:hypothetical protein
MIILIGIIVVGLISVFGFISMNRQIKKMVDKVDL